MCSSAGVTPSHALTLEETGKQYLFGGRWDSGLNRMLLEARPPTLITFLHASDAQ